MKSLYKYLDRIGADYESTTYGNNYFKNVPAFEYPAAIVSFDYSSGEIPAHYMKQVQREKMIKKYCDRYGYFYHSFGSYPGCFWFTICRRDDYEKSEFIRMYERESIRVCEQVIHDASIRDLKIDIEKMLRDIMDSFGRDYLEAVRMIEKTA